MKDLILQTEDERRHADQYKEQVGDLVAYLVDWWMIS